MNLKSSEGSVPCKKRPSSPGSDNEEEDIVGDDGNQLKDLLRHGDGSDGDDTDVPFDKGWAWMICFSCFIIFYVYAGYDQVVSVLLVDILKDLDTTVYVMSVMFSVSTCFYCLSTQLTNNLLLKHVSARSLQTVAAIINFMATLLFVIHPTSTLFLVTSFIKSAAKGTSLISTVTMVGHYFKRRRALAVALGLIGGSMSSISVPPLTRYLRDEYGLRGCFLLVASLEMHAVMANMILRPINSYRKSKLRVEENRNGAPRDEENRLLSPQKVSEEISSDPNTETEMKVSLEVDLSTSAENVPLNKNRDDPAYRKGYKVDNNSPGCVSRGEVSALELHANALGRINQNESSIHELKKIHATVHNAVPVACTSCRGVAVPVNPLSDDPWLKDCDDVGSMGCTCCHDNETTAQLSLEAQPSSGGSLETLRDYGDCSERDRHMAVEVQTTVTQSHAKQTLTIPTFNGIELDKFIIDKEIINSLTSDMQSNDIKTAFDIEAHVIQNPDIQKHVIQTSDKQYPNIQTHVIQTTDLKAHEPPTPNQEVAKIMIIGKDRGRHSLTRSFPSRWHSASSFIIGSDLNIQPFTEEHLQSVNHVSRESKSRKVCKMTSWIKVIVNFPLLKNAMCSTIICIYCLTNGGVLNMMYLPSYARHVGISSQEAALLMTILGACDMVARILSGYFVDLKIVKVHVIMGVSIFCSGVVSHCMGLFLTFELLIFYVVVHGLIGSVGASLDTVLIVEALGIGYLSKVLSMCSLFFNVSIATQQLIVGALIEYTDNYVVAFQYVGSMYLLASILLLGLPIVKRLQHDREKKN